MAGTADLSLRFAQGEVFNARDRFRVLVAGRRFGKSYLSPVSNYCVERSKNRAKPIFTAPQRTEWRKISPGRS